MNIEWMNCTTCKALVQINNTGICLGCQMGFTRVPQEDAYPVQQEEEVKTNADEKHSPEVIPMGDRPKAGKRVRKKNSKRKKTAKKSKKKKEISDGVQGI